MTITESPDIATAPVAPGDTAPPAEAQGAAADMQPAPPAAVEPAPAKRERARRAPPSERAARASRAASDDAAEGDRRTTAQRLGNFPRADRPATIAAPEHHHLPGWVRRDFARARPPLSNILALLEGDLHEQFARRIAELNEGISSGRFSLAWQYPDLVDEGRTLYERQRRDHAEGARVRGQLDSARRRVQDRVRDAAEGSLPADVSARLQRQLRSAASQDEINAVGAELDGVLNVVRSSADKRREREIERTKARIKRSAAAAGVATAEPQAESWQDVLRRFAEQQAAGTRSGE